MPIDQLELQDADHVLRLLTIRHGEAAAVEHLDFGHAQQPLFNLLHQFIPFIHRQVAAGMHQHLCRFRLHIREEFDTVIEATVEGVDQQHAHEHH